MGLIIVSFIVGIFFGCISTLTYIELKKGKDKYNEN